MSLTRWDLWTGWRRWRSLWRRLMGRCPLCNRPNNSVLVFGETGPAYCPHCYQAGYRVEIPRP